MILVAHEKLRQTAASLLTAAGLPDHHAEAAAAGLIRADLRGVETHGVSNMLRNYLQWLEDGSLNPRPKLRTAWSLGGLEAVDSDRGLGLAIMPEIVEKTVARAAESGIAATAVLNGRHAGMLAHHALLAAEKGMIGICLTATSARVVPTWGREPRLGTNPIAIAAPMTDGRYLAFDAATSMVAGNRVTTALRTGAKLPRGSIVYDTGATNDGPTEASRDYLRRLAPLGGLADEASHKGYGLAVLVELLCGTLFDDGGLPERPPGGATHFMCVIAPPAGERPSMIASVTRLAEYLTATPPAEGRERVLYPGQLEAEEEVRRRAGGVPLHPEVYRWISGACEKYGVEVPAPLAAPVQAHEAGVGP
jgi:LDH2 family malate/lactate/ureidoglycolate dehydrogenase